MAQLKRERRVDIGQYELTVRMPARAADQLAGSLLYRKLLRPSARSVYHALRTVQSSRVRSHGAGAPASGITSFPATPPRPEDLDPEALALIQRVAPIDWYHSIDLGHGVVTPGFVDHRDQLPLYQIPESLAGLRCLDIGTFDGFFAFEMERRGAAEVVATDIAQGIDCDLPKALLPEARKANEKKEMGKGFRLAREILGSSVRHEICNVYDLSPERVGQFDFVVLSDLLVHLRDPQLALERVASVCRGRAIVADVYTPMLEGYGELCLSMFVPWLPNFTWWLPSSNTLKKMMTIAGFEPVTEVSRFALNAKNGTPIHKVVLHAAKPASPTWKNVLRGEVNPANATTEDKGPSRGRQLSLGPVEVTLARAGERERPLAPGNTDSHVAGTPVRRNTIRAIPDTPDAQAIGRRIADIDWYHTLDLGHGVTTPGFVDHRGLVSAHCLPDDLSGKRCLDVATFDGFWAFEMERRGAYEVVATDVATGSDCDIPSILIDEIARQPEQRVMGRGFTAAQAILKSGVKYKVLSVYDLTPERIGTFDFIFVSDLLLHLRDPQLALERIRSVCRGAVVLADAYSPMLETYSDLCLSQFVPWEWIGNYAWWLPNSRTLATMLNTAGFERVTELNRFSYPSRSGNQVDKVVFEGIVPPGVCELDAGHPEEGN